MPQSRESQQRKYLTGTADRLLCVVTGVFSELRCRPEGNDNKRHPKAWKGLATPSAGKPL